MVLHTEIEIIGVSPDWNMIYCYKIRYSVCCGDENDWLSVLISMLHKLEETLEKQHALLLASMTSKSTSGFRLYEKPPKDRREEAIPLLDGAMSTLQWN
jgi:hypothetical protein